MQRKATQNKAKNAYVRLLPLNEVVWTVQARGEHDGADGTEANRRSDTHGDEDAAEAVAAVVKELTKRG